jgi:hypothetical protein
MPSEFHLDMKARVVSTLGATTHLGTSPIHDATVSLMLDFLDGTGVDQINAIYARQRTLASGATDTIDINGVTNDVFNQNIAMLTLCGVIILNKAVDGVVNTTNLTLGGGANAIPNVLGTAGATKIIRPGGLFMSVDGAAAGIGPVTPGTADTITVVNAAGAENRYQIILFGRTV